MSSSFVARVENWFALARRSVPGRPEPCTARASWAAAPTAAWLRSVETTRRFPDCAQTRSGRTRGKSGSVCDQLSSSEEQRNIFGSPVLNEKPARTKKTKFSKNFFKFSKPKNKTFLETEVKQVKINNYFLWRDRRRRSTFPDSRISNRSARKWFLW